MHSTHHDRPVSTDATRRSIQVASAGLPLDNVADFDDTERGFVGRSEQRQILADDGHVVWDLDAYRFLDGSVPDKANPNLWRQGQLLIRDGLFEVMPGIDQVRGYNFSVTSLIEGGSGVIVVDPLTSRESAAAAFARYRKHRGDRPVTAMIYTHSHIDHFGGVKGVILPARKPGMFQVLSANVSGSVSGYCICCHVSAGGASSLTDCACGSADDERAFLQSLRGSATTLQSDEWQPTTRRTPPVFATPVTAGTPSTTLVGGTRIGCAGAGQ